MSNIPKIIINVESGCNTCGHSLITTPDNGGCGCHAAQLPNSFETSNSPCNDCENPCEDSVLTDCIFYNAGDIPQLGIKTNDLLTKIIISLSAEIITLKQRLATANIP